MPPSPTVEGFRAAFHRPSLTFTEIAWRWTTGAVACALALFFFVEYLDTLPVSRADTLLLSTRQPAFIGRALSHILQGSLSRAVFAALIAALALSALWIVAASIGRFATVRALTDYFQTRFAGIATIQVPSDPPAEPAPAKAHVSPKSRSTRGLLKLNFLRVSVVLALFLALGGSAILSGFASSNAHPRPGLSLILFLFLAGLLFAAAWALNWWLSLAEVFAVRNGEDALTALSSAVSFSRNHLGPVLAFVQMTQVARNHSILRQLPRRSQVQFRLFQIRHPLVHPAERVRRPGPSGYDARCPSGQTVVPEQPAGDSLDAAAAAAGP